MHAIQTSGNCIRNVTADHFAGAAADEVADPRPYAEIIRQWSSLHPEFSFLPRKFKVAVIASEKDRAAMQLHDIGLHLKRLADGRLVFAVWVGGGQGRTPIIAKKIRDDLPEADLLSYLEAILRVYNLQGRRDNKYKARIKILVHEIGAEAFAREVEEEWQRIRDGALKLPAEEIRRIEAYFAPPAFESRPAKASLRAPDRAFDRWVTRNTHAHRQPGYSIVTISLKPIGGIPGDASRRADGRRRRSRRALLLRRGARHARAEPGAAARAPVRPVGGLSGAEAGRPGRGQRRARHRHHRLPRPRLLRARQCPLDPHRPAHLRAACRPAGHDRRSQDQDLGLHQRLRSPSRRPHRHPGRGEARRGALPAPARRLGCRGRDARFHHRPRLRSRRHRRRRREGRRPLPRAARRPRRALPRRLRPPRPRPLQGGALCVA